MPFLKVRKRAQREHHPETHLKGHIILHRAPQIHIGDVSPNRIVRYEADAVALCGLDAYDSEADEEHEGFAEDTYAEACEESCTISS